MSNQRSILKKEAIKKKDPKDHRSDIKNSNDGLRNQRCLQKIQGK